MNLLKFKNDNAIPGSQLTELKTVPKAFVNLTNVAVDSRMEALLSYGPQFALPTKVTLFNAARTITDLHAIMEYEYTPSITKLNMREILDNTVLDLDNYMKVMENEDSRTNHLLQQAVKVTADFFRTHEDIIIIQADKGNRTAIIYKKDYLTKMENHVTNNINRGIYKKKDNFEKIERAICAAHKRLRTKLAQLASSTAATNGELIYNRDIKNQLYLDKFEVPTLYGTIKCHKDNLPIRPICASRLWYASGIQKVINYHLMKSLGHLLCKNNVTNIDNVIKEIYSIPVMEPYVWVKFDVQDMYTSMDRNDIYKFLRGIISHPDFQETCAIESNLLLQLIYFSLETANYVKYGDTVYSQLKGLPQGAADSGLYATLFLDYTLQLYNELLFIQNRVVHWFKYMDDFILYIPKDNIDAFKNSFEKVTRLKLDKEDEIIHDEYAEIAFLDITIKRRKNKMEICTYRKNCASQRMINYLSHVPNVIKMNTINQMIKKILSRTCNDSVNQDLEDLEYKLYANNYPRIDVKRRFQSSIGIYLKELKKGYSNIPLTPQEIKDRIAALYMFISRFNTKSHKNLNVTERNVAKNSVTKRYAIYDSHCIPFERLIRRIHKVYKLSECAFRLRKNVYSKINGTTPQKLLRCNSNGTSLDNNEPASSYQMDTTTMNDTVHEDNLGLVKCAECDTFFILKGKSRVEFLLEEEIKNENSHIVAHMRLYRHAEPTTIYNLNYEKLNDASTQVQIYLAMVSSIGIAYHNIDAVTRIPYYIREFIAKYIDNPKIEKGLPNMKNNTSENDKDAMVCLSNDIVEDSMTPANTTNASTTNDSEGVNNDVTGNVVIISDVTTNEFNYTGSDIDMTSSSEDDVTT